MKLNLLSAVAVVASVFLASCAATKLKHSAKAPDYQGGPVGAVAVVAVDERLMLRQVLEGQFATQLRAAGESALTTADLLSLAETKANKEAAAARFREAGAKSILIVRLVDQDTQARVVQETGSLYVPVTTGFETGWYNYFTVAFVDMGTTRGSVKQTFYLDSSLFDLTTGKRIWSGLTATTVSGDTDRLSEVQPLVAAVVGGLRKDGVIQ
jgi:hypothetical protein